MSRSVLNTVLRSASCCRAAGVRLTAVCAICNLRTVSVDVLFPTGSSGVSASCDLNFEAQKYIKRSERRQLDVSLSLQ